MLIDKFLPTYEFNEVHTIRVNASPEVVYRAIKNVTAEEIPLFGALMGLRALPVRLTGKVMRASDDDNEPLLNYVLKSSFVLLTEAPNHELVVGTIQKFWQASGGLPPERITTTQQFMEFAALDYGRAVLNFAIAPARSGAGCKVRTETRIHIPDPQARRKFAAYWFFIQPGSAIIRRAWLWAIKKRAERDY
ncbi:MAG: hypothetical protein ABIO92_01710 [Chloroflexia bacterium]